MVENAENSEKVLAFLGNDPGAARYGNFINYYEFNPAENRTKLLPNEIWTNLEENFICLDIGCNTGELTQELYSFLNKSYSHKNVHILGIDIDPTLITRAKEANKYPNNIAYQCLNFMNVKERLDIFSSYLSNNNNKKNNFDVIFCFSITMWIHLNNGDEGLIQFLKEICTITKYIIIEPQPWKCYKTAVRRMKRKGSEFPLFSTLTIKKNVEQFIEQTIINEGFRKLIQTKNTEWGRKILIFESDNCTE